MEEHDLPEKYAKDIFIDELTKGDQRTYSENYVRLADKLEKITNPDRFIEEYPEVYDCLPEEGDAAIFVSDIYDLFQRHQQSVNEVLEKQTHKYVPQLRKGELPNSCLIAMVASGRTKIDPRIGYVERLRSLIRKGLPPAFQTEKAKNEKHVQDVGQGIFIAAKETLTREGPQLPFAGVNTKPDFSDISDPTGYLFIEFKYPKERSRLNSIITEMTSRVTIYKDQSAYALFIVYDPNRTIIDDDAFRGDFEKHDGIWVGISR